MFLNLFCGHEKTSRVCYIGALISCVVLSTYNTFYFLNTQRGKIMLEDVTCITPTLNLHYLCKLLTFSPIVGLKSFLLQGCHSMRF